jgi:hypothetical protein
MALQAQSTVLKSTLLFGFVVPWLPDTFWSALVGGTGDAKFVNGVIV